jgi:hypothetical protein
MNATAVDALEHAKATRLRQLVDMIVRDVCELPDYNSPDDQPDLLQCTTRQLSNILDRHLGPMLDVMVDAALARDLLAMALRKIQDDIPARPNMTEAGRVAMMAEVARVALEGARL